MATYSDFYYYRGAKHVRINDLLGHRINTTNPEYPCIHCGVPIMDHKLIDLDTCTRVIDDPSEIITLPCQWWLNCPNKATHTRYHTLLGETVPICDYCEQHFGDYDWKKHAQERMDHRNR